VGTAASALSLGSSSCKSRYRVGGESNELSAVDRGVEHLRSYVHRRLNGKIWLIGNGLTEREVRFEGEIGLRSVRWLHKVTGTDFLQRAQAEKQWGNEFSFESNGLLFTDAAPPPSYWNTPPFVTFDLVGSAVNETTPPGKCLEIKLRANFQPVEVSTFYAVYDGHPVVRKWIAITNRGTRAVTLSHLVFEAVWLAADPACDLELYRFYGIRPHEIFCTGRYEDPAIMQRNSRTGEGLIVMNEAPGCMKRTEVKGWGSGPVEVMYDTDLFPFERRIKPGETFTSAGSSVAFFLEGSGFSDPGWVMPSYTSEVIKRAGAA
jgi:alpha-galactosidase